jgi:peroxiredoxin
MPRTLRRLAAGLVTGAALLLAASPAAAGIGSGDVAPDFEGKSFFNTAPITLQSLRGRLVLFELFSTGCGPCRAQVGHLNELQEKYGPKGFTIVGVSKEPGSSLEKFVAELGAKYPIVAESTDSMRAYGRNSFPSAFLIGPDGRVLWDGHPASLPDATIEEHLERVRVLPAFPDSLKWIGSQFEKHKYGAALAKVEDLIVRGNIGADDLPIAEAIRDWFTWYATSAFDGATRDVGEGRFYEASLAYASIEELYKGHALATQAKSALKDLLADPARREEIKAGERLAKILAEIRAGNPDPEDTLKLLKPLLARKYAETRAGRQAAEMAAALGAKGS